MGEKRGLMRLPRLPSPSLHGALAAAACARHWRAQRCRGMGGEGMGGVRMMRQQMGLRGHAQLNPQLFKGQNCSKQTVGHGWLVQRCAVTRRGACLPRSAPPACAACTCSGRRRARRPAPASFRATAWWLEEGVRRERVGLRRTETICCCCCCCCCCLLLSVSVRRCVARRSSCCCCFSAGACARPVSVLHPPQNHTPVPAGPPTESTCAPQPAHVGLPQLEQSTRRHIFARLRGGRSGAVRRR